MHRHPRAIARLLRLALLTALAALGAAGAQAATCIGSAGKRCAYDRIATYGERTPGELSQPTSVALGADGRIYVVDTQTRVDVAYLFVYDRSGEFLQALAPPGGGRFAPTEVGVSADGTVYALDPDLATMHRFGADGGYRALRLPRAEANRLAVQRDGSFWLLYGAGSTITHSDADGQLIGAFTVRDIDRNSALSVDADGHIFVGRWNKGVTEYTSGGSELGTFRSTSGGHVAFAGNGDLVTGVGDLIYRIPRSGGGSTAIGWSDSNGAGLSQVDGIVVAPPGLMAAGRPGEEAYVVADRDNHRVQVLATDGSRLAIVGAPRDATLVEPRAAWGLPGGSMIVADTLLRRLVRIGPSGAFEGRADGGVVSFPLDGALNPVTGDSVILDGGFDLRRFGPDGASLGGWPMPGVVKGATNSGFGGGVAVAEDGTIWAAHSPAPHGGYVAAYRPDGTPLRTIADPHIDRPSSITTGPGGEVFVVEAGGANSSVVDVFGPDGRFRRRLDSLTCLWVSSLAVDGAGRIYAGQRDRITVLDRSGALLARFGALGRAVGQFDGTQLSVLGDVLTIAETNNGRVTRVRIDPAALTSPDPDPCGGVRMMQTTIPVQGAVAQVPLDCEGTLGADLRRRRHAAAQQRQGGPAAQAQGHPRDGALPRRGSGLRRAEAQEGRAQGPQPEAPPEGTRRRAARAGRRDHAAGDADAPAEGQGQGQGEVLNRPCDGPVALAGAFGMADGAYAL